MEHEQSNDLGYKSIFEKAAEGIVAINHAGIIVLSNRSLCQMFGYQSEELIGKPLSILLPANVHKRHEKHVEGFFMNIEARKMNADAREFSGVKKDGSPFQVEVSLSSALIENEIHAIGFVVDITEKVKAENELKRVESEFRIDLENKVKERTKELQATQTILAESLQKEKELSQLKSRFVATASHEFRTPLTVIQSSVALLDLMKDQMPLDLQNLVDRVHKDVEFQIEKMTELMDDVLDLSKIKDGNIEPKFEWVNLSIICEQLVKKYNRIQNNGFQMLTTSEGNMRKIFLDKKLISHALNNIISNAFKFSISSQKLNLHLSYTELSVTVIISNVGLGIPAEEISSIFDPFMRGSNVKGIPGSGFGLSLSKEYIEKNKGEISVNSNDTGYTEFITVFDL